MSDVKIECPHCHKSFKLNETLAAPVVEETRRKMAEEYREKEEQLEEKKAAFAREQTDADKARKELERERSVLSKEREKIEERVAEQVAEQRAAIEREAMKKAKQKLDEKLAEQDEEKKELEEQLKEKDAKLADARKQETEFRRKQRELEDAKRELDLTAEKKAGELVASQLDKIRKDAEDAARLPIREKDKTIADLQAKLEEAVRKAAQGSMQLQGEVQELDLENTLRSKFPRDTFEPVAKGERGADVLQRVFGPVGQECGCVLWESKRTKNWSDGWLPKLREDQRAAKAEIAVVVTQALPKGVETFDHIDGVWVTSTRCALPVAVALRQSLIELHGARQAGEGMETKRDLVYQYVTGPRFRQRVQAIVEAFSEMQDDLRKERTAITKMWNKREEQLLRVMQGTVGVYGDLQGIAGKSLPEISGLALEDASSSALLRERQ